MRQARVFLVAVLVAAGLMVSAAGPAAAVDTGYITIYKDHGLAGGELYRWSITGGCWGGRYIVAYILSYEIQRASSIRFLGGGPNNQDCNYLKVRDGANGWNYQGQCVNVVNNWFNFDYQHNDRSDAWVLEYNPSCRLYYNV